MEIVADSQLVQSHANSEVAAAALKAKSVCDTTDTASGQAIEKAPLTGPKRHSQGG
jgi:hypothetical protein